MLRNEQRMYEREREKTEESEQAVLELGDCSWVCFVHPRLTCPAQIRVISSLDPMQTRKFERVQSREGMVLGGQQMFLARRNGGYKKRGRMWDGGTVEEVMRTLDPRAGTCKVRIGDPILILIPPYIGHVHIPI